MDTSRHEESDGTDFPRGATRTSAIAAYETASMTSRPRGYGATGRTCRPARRASAAAARASPSAPFAGRPGAPHPLAAVARASTMGERPLRGRRRRRCAGGRATRGYASAHARESVRTRIHVTACVRSTAHSALEAEAAQKLDAGAGYAGYCMWHEARC